MLNERKRIFALRVDRITVNFLFILDTPRFKLSRALFDRSFRRPFALSVPGKLFDSSVSRSGENGNPVCDRSINTFRGEEKLADFRDSVERDVCV